MSFGESPADKIRREINIKRVLAYFGIEVNRDGRYLCPFHDDHNPTSTSVFANDEAIYCFACGEGKSVVELVQDLLDEKVPIYCAISWQRGPQKNTVEVCEWITSHQEEFPKIEGTTARKRGGYRGPVMPDLVDFWHSCLTEEHREELHTHRLLSDDTINLNQIGWRPDWKAFTLPFWEGQPRQSAIVTVQFRLTKDSPEKVTFYTQERKFTSLTGHSKRALIGRHTLTKDWGIILFGTFDALLAGQDGFPAVSPNGASSFSGMKAKEELAELLKDLKRVYVVYDATPSERKSSQKSIEGLTCEVVEREFTDEKDYGDYRLKHSTKEFLTDILGWRLQ